MGQYRQWLYYREVDQQFHAQLAQLTEELTTLKRQLQPLEDGLSLSDNAIIHALSLQLQSEASAAQPILVKADAREGLTPAEAAREEADRRSTEEVGIGVSPALHGWTSLPNFDLQRLSAQPSVLHPDTHPEIAPAITTHPELDLLPKDMATFVDEHTHTVPLRTPPKWLRAILDNTTEQEGTPINQQNERTNQLVERWLERWGRSEAEPQREDQE